VLAATTVHYIEQRQENAKINKNIQQLLPLDRGKRYRYCEWLLSKLKDDPCMSDAIRWAVVPSCRLCELSEYSRMVGGKSPFSPWNSPHPDKVGVWCAVSCRRINSKRYIDVIHEFLGPFAQVCSQQYRATCHTARKIMCEVSLLFGDVIISKGLWPPRSPDFSPPNYYVGATLKM
jgi:hypothetical protein